MDGPHWTVGLAATALAFYRIATLPALSYVPENGRSPYSPSDYTASWVYPFQRTLHINKKTN